MGYYDGADVPVYDHLAEEFAVCDRWFASVPGATLPNRLYALCGVAAGSRDDRPSHVPPLYHQPSFVRHLDAHRHLLALVFLRPRDAAPGRCPLPAGAPPPVRLLQQDRPAVEDRFRHHLQPEDPQLPRRRRGRHAAAGVLDRPGVHQLQPARLPRQRRPPHRPTSKTARTWFWPSTTRWPQARSGTARCWSSSTTKTAASTITSRRPRPQTMSPACSAATACACQRSSSRRGSNRAPYRTPCSITPRSSKRSCCASAPKPCDQPQQAEQGRARLGLGPQYPGTARGPGQPSRGTADPHHATTRPAAGCPGAASRGQGREPKPASRPGRRGEATIRSTTCRKASSPRLTN